MNVLWLAKLHGLLIMRRDKSKRMFYGMTEEQILANINGEIDRMLKYISISELTSILKSEDSS